jgi:hypothetical protein
LFHIAFDFNLAWLGRLGSGMESGFKAFRDEVPAHPFDGSPTGPQDLGDVLIGTTHRQRLIGQ